LLRLAFAARVAILVSMLAVFSIRQMLTS
jgi:hypothetical protein